MLYDRVISVFILFFLFSTISIASELTVYTEEWPPYNFTSNGKIVGISTELVKAALKKSGFRYKIVMAPWKRAYKIVKNNKNTILYTTSRTGKREMEFKWIGPLYPRRVNLYKLKKRKDIKLNTVSDLKGYKISVIRGGSTEELLTSKGLIKDKHFTAVTRVNQCILMLFFDRVDLIPGGQESFLYLIKKMNFNINDLEIAFTLVDDVYYYMAVNLSTSDEVVFSIQKALDELIFSGYKTEIYKKYQIEFPDE